jgi:lysophospholipase L1-like esterase
MKFSTAIPLSPVLSPISYDSEVFSLGSCFAQHMADKLEYFGFKSICNPLGILFQPTALETFLSHVVNKKVFAAVDVFDHQELWHNFDAHSDLSRVSIEETVSGLNRAVELSSHHLATATHIIITLGTAWVYRHKTSGKRVANCHKVPQVEFDKELLSVEEVRESVFRMIGLIRQINPNALMIFTISPVRHIKDGFVGNQRSKAHLIAGLHDVLEHEQGSSYFPSYEIVMDELRDYRFYDSDMLHPSAIAIDYIWEKFTESHLSEQAISLMGEVDAVRKAMAHRPFNVQALSHQNFQLQLQLKKSALLEKIPHLVL